MSNCCLNTIKIEGPEPDLLSLRDHINAVRRDPLSKQYRNLYLLLLRLGYSEEEAKNTEMREDFTGGDAEIRDGVLCLDTESAWDFQGAGWEMVHSKYSNCSIYFQAEEFGCDIFCTNDTSGHLFPDKYCLDWGDDETGECDMEYFHDDCSLIEYVHDHFDSTVGTFEEAKAALKEFSEGNRCDAYANLYEISYMTEYNLKAANE